MLFDKRFLKFVSTMGLISQIVGAFYAIIEHKPFWFFMSLMLFSMLLYIRVEFLLDR